MKSPLCRKGIFFRCLSVVSAGCLFFLFPWLCVLLEWHLLDSLRPLSLLFSPYYLCPVGGQAVLARCGAAQQGQSPDTMDSYFPLDAQDGENRELAITWLLAIYTEILASFALLWRLSEGQAKGNENNTLLMDYWCVHLRVYKRRTETEQSKGKDTKKCFCWHMSTPSFFDFPVSKSEHPCLSVTVKVLSRNEIKVWFIYHNLLFCQQRKERQTETLCLRHEVTGNQVCFHRPSTQTPAGSFHINTLI